MVADTAVIPRPPLLCLYQREEYPLVGVEIETPPQFPFGFPGEAERLVEVERWLPQPVPEGTRELIQAGLS